MEDSSKDRLARPSGVTDVREPMGQSGAEANPHFNPEKAARGDGGNQARLGDEPFPPWPFDSAVTGLVEVNDGPIDFDPVPRLRKRRNGWTPDAQRAFIEALASCGCVARSARAVGMSSRSAYRLLDAAGADSFAAAWDQAIARGIEALRIGALDRALNGAWVPVVRRGKLVRHEKRHDNRLAVALLSGRTCSVADRRERAGSRRRYRLKLLARREAEAEQKRRAAQIWVEHQAIIDKIEQEQRAQPVRGTGEHGARDPVPKSVTAPPRIRSL